MLAETRSRRGLRGRALLFGAVYFACAEGCRLITPVSGVYVNFWLPAGLWVSVLLLNEPADWLSLLVAGTASNLLFDGLQGTGLVASLGFACSNWTGAVGTAWLMRRAAVRRPGLTTLRELLGLLVCGGVVGPAIAATVGAATLVGTGLSGSYLKSWYLWWIGNSMAVLVLAPFVLAWLAPIRWRPRLRENVGRLVEACLLVAALLGVCAYCMLWDKGILSAHKYLVVPLLLISALRFGVRGASAVNFLFSMVVYYLATHLAGGPPGEAIGFGEYNATVLSFIAIGSMVGLVPAIALAERDGLLKQLRTSEDRFRNLVAAANEGVVITEHGVVIDISDQALRMLGYERADILGRHVAELVSPTTRSAVMEAIATEREQPYEHLTLRKDGSVFAAETQAKVTEIDGRRLRMTALRDISERKRNEQFLAGQNRVLEMIASGSPLTATLGALIGVAESQISGMVGSVLLRDGSRLRHAMAPHVPEEFVQAVEGLEIGDNRGVCGTAAHLRRPIFSEDLAKDSRCVEFWSLAAAHNLHACWSMPILDDKQSVLGTFALYGAKPALPTDKERRLLESVAHTASIAISSHANRAALSESEEKFAKVFRASPDAVSISDLETGRIIEANTSYENLFGYPRADLVGRSIDEIGIYANRRERDDWIQLIKLNGSVRGREMRLTTRLRSVVTCIVGGELIELGGRTHVVTVIHDITDRLQLQENLRQAQKMDAIGQLSGGIAHDFNNLLTVIMGNLGLIRVAGELTPGATESLEQIAYAANRAANLTRQLLEFSRKRVLLRQDLDLNEVIGSFSKMLRRVIGETVDFELNLADAPLPVSADRAMIEQVVLNLSLNARDAMPKGGKLTLTTSSVAVGADDARRLSASRAGSFALLTVTDTGTGIDHEHLEHIFEPFFTTKEVGKGTGLGLASVYGILQQHHGWVSVRSELGKGTTFDVHLPLRESSDFAKVIPVSLIEVSGGSEMILLVEDDVAVRLVAEKSLSQLGYRVLVAGDGKEARILWGRNRGTIDLLLTDMVMPGGLSGADIAREFKAEAPSLKVIFMSGYSADLAGMDFSSQGSDSFLGKPFSVSELAAMVRRSLANPPTSRS